MRYTANGELGAFSEEAFHKVVQSSQNVGIAVRMWHLYIILPEGRELYLSKRICILKLWLNYGHLCVTSTRYTKSAASFWVFSFNVKSTWEYKLYMWNLGVLQVIGYHFL